MEYYTALKKNENALQALIRKAFGDILIRKRGRNKTCMCICLAGTIELWEDPYKIVGTGKIFHCIFLFHKFYFIFKPCECLTYSKKVLINNEKTSAAVQRGESRRSTLHLGKFLVLSVLQFYHLCNTDNRTHHNTSGTGPGT